MPSLLSSINRSLNIIILGALLSVGSLAASANTYAIPLSDEDLHSWGYIDRTGNLVIKPRFSMGDQFHEGIAKVRIDDNPYEPSSRFIDTTGSFLSIPAFLKGAPFQNGTSWIFNYPRPTSLVTAAGEISPFKEDIRFVESFAEGFNDGNLKANRCLVDEQGKICVNLDPEIDQVEQFSEGLAACLVDGKWGYLDHSGKCVIKPQFVLAGRFKDGMAVVKVVEQDLNDVPVEQRHEAVWAVIDRRGDIRFQITAAFLDDFSEGLAKFVSNSKCGFIDTKGNVAIKPTYKGVLAFREGLAPAERENTFDENSSWGYINRLGETVVPFKFYCPKYGRVRLPGQFSEGLAKMWEEKTPGKLRWGFIDRQGNWVIEPKFASAGMFTEGLAPVSTHDSWTPNRKLPFNPSEHMDSIK